MPRTRSMSIPDKPTSTIPKSDTLHVPVLGPSTSYSLLQPRVPPTCTRLTTAIPRVSRICIVALQNLHVPGQPFAPPLQAISSASRSSRQGALPAQVNVQVRVPPSAVPSARRLGAKKHTILPSASALHLHQQPPDSPKSPLLFCSLPLRALTGN